MKDSDRLDRFAKHIAAAAKLYGWEIMIPNTKEGPITWVVIGGARALKKIEKKLRGKK